MYNIHLFTNYNNYYNRQVKFKATLNEYLTDDDIFLITFQKRNFVIADGIRTQHVIEYAEHLPTPNYLIAEDEKTHAFTRWFVIECRQTRGMQYTLSLKRDTIADFYDTIKASPLLVKKGYVDDNNVLVFNKEMQEYNKVKKNELLIKDKTNSGYVVGFIDQDKDHASKIYTSYKTELQVDFDYSALPSSVTDYMAIGNATPNSTAKRIVGENKANVCLKVNFGSYKFIEDGLGRDIYSNYNLNEYFWMNGYRGKYTVITDTGTNYGNGIFYTVSTTIGSYSLSNNCIIDCGENGKSLEIANQVSLYVANKFSQFELSYIEDWFSINTLSKATVESYDGKICEISGTYYRCEVTRSGSATLETITPPSYELATLKNLMPSSELSYWASYNNNITPKYVTGHSPSDMLISDFTAYANTEQVYIKLVQQDTNIYTYLTPSANRNHLIDNPYDMFVIPYSDEMVYEVNSTNYNANKNMAINLAQAICQASGSSVYDIQIVPYCPFNIPTSPSIDFSLINSQAIYLNADDTVCGYYFWASKSSGELTISENREELTLSGDSYSYKEITQLRQYFICSPNKESVYEFNPAMNKGVTEWKISYDYRPFSSYIKVQPTWNYLYSLNTSTFNGLTDQRGLLYNGNYSITQLSNAWNEYVNSNKNYQAIFDTEIKTQISQNQLQNKAYEETIGIRSYNLNPIKAVMNVIGMEKEIDFMRENQSIDINARRQLFNYQLDNIKSQPNTIRKMTSINTDFRIFPFVEVYDATPQDKQNFDNLIKYNGMTIMVMGFMEEYLQANTETFFQASVVRFTDYIGVENDYTLVSDINNELEMGLYITKEV